MYQKIMNPISGRFVSIHGKIGRNIIKNYIINLSGGGWGSANSDILDTLEKSQTGGGWGSVNSDILDTLEKSQTGGGWGSSNSYIINVSE